MLCDILRQIQIEYIAVNRCLAFVRKVPIRSRCCPYRGNEKITRIYAGYKAVVPTGPMTDHWLLLIKRLCPPIALVSTGTGDGCKMRLPQKIQTKENRLFLDRKGLIMIIFTQ
jgi:hypothetical protein